MQVLDAVSPLERIKLSANLAAQVKLLSGEIGALARVSASARVAAILRELGVGAAPVAAQGAETGFPLKEAASSYSGISHSGSSRAKADAEDYEKTISQAVEEARPLAETDAQRAVLASEEAAFRADYLSHYRQLMGVRAGTYSGHIAGRSSLNSKQANARNSALDKAMDRFYGWVKTQDGRIKRAVVAARSPEQKAAAQAEIDAAQAAKDAKAAEAAQKSVDLMLKLITFKSGDKLPVGSAIVTKVNKNREGVPSSLTVTLADGTKPFDDKIDVLRVLYRGDKSKLASDFASAMAMLEPAAPGRVSGAEFQQSIAADEYAAKVAGFASFADYAKAREETPGAELAFNIARAKYTIIQRLAAGRSDKLELESLTLHGANPRGPEALSQLRNARIVERNIRAQSGQYQLAQGVTLESFVSSSLADAQKPSATADGTTRAVAGGQEGMNGYQYKGGQFLPNTMAEPGKWKIGGKWVTGGKEQVAPGEWEFSPTPFSRSIYMASGLSVYGEDAGGGQLRLRAGLRDNSGSPVTLESDVTPGVRGVLSKTKFTLGEMLSAYNQGLRWVEVEPNAETITTQDAGELAKAVAKFKAIAARAPQAEPPADEGGEPLQLVEHATKGGKGKIIRGIVRTDLSYAEAKAIDEYTFKKNGGWFIREKHLDGFKGEAAVPVVVKPELTPEQQAQEAADRLADEQLKEQKKRAAIAEKLRAAGEATVEKAEQELGTNRQTNTARRADMASSIMARNEAARAMGKTMLNLAAAIESGDAVHLAGISSRAAVEALQDRLVQGMYEADRAANMTYAEQQRQKGRPATEADVQHAKLPMPMWGSAGTSLAKVLEAIKGKKGSVELAKKIRFTPGPDAEILRALKAMIGDKEFSYVVGWWNIEAVARLERLRRAGITNNTELRAALSEYLQYREGARGEDPIKKAERAIIGQKVGIDFFPTPVATASRMADLARISKGDRVLEPSAGNGNLADAAKAKGAEVDVLEISSQLRDILTAKGYNVVGYDFEAFTPEEKYDAVIMNPPFGSGTNRLDSLHIQRAFDMLKPGGRLVAIAGEGVFIGRDAKAVQFRDWLDSHGADVEQLEQNTFKDKNLLATTGANGRLIVLTK